MYGQDVCSNIASNNENLECTERVANQKLLNIGSHIRIGVYDGVMKTIE